MPGGRRYKGSMNLHVVLVQPLIPPNTGNIARLTAATRVKLHLIEPLGFELTDRYLKRAGLDYWPETQVNTYSSWETFLEDSHCKSEQLWLFSTHAACSYYEAAYKSGDYLVFGNETHGLAKEFHERYAERRVQIPMDNPKVRSLNLSTSVGIALYEARRQFAIT